MICHKELLPLDHIEKIEKSSSNLQFLSCENIKWKYKFFIFSPLWNTCIIFDQYFPVFHYIVDNKIIYHEWEDGFDKSVLRITAWNNEACWVMANVDCQGQIFLSHPHMNNGVFSWSPLSAAFSYWNKTKFCSLAGIIVALLEVFFSSDYMWVVSPFLCYIIVC